MTTSKKSNWQIGISAGTIRCGFTAIEGLTEPQFIDYSIVEESYELLPSGD